MAARRSRSPARSKAAREFVSEVEEILDRMRGDLSDLADQRARGELDPDCVNQLFRSAHSLKGLAGMFGLERVSDLAHHLEDILDGLRMGRMRADSPAIDLLDEAVSLIAAVLERVGGRKGQAESEAELAEMVSRIEASLVAPAPEPGKSGRPGIDESILRALTEYEEHRLDENLARGRAVHLLESTFEILSFEEGLASLTASAREVGEVIATLPAPGDLPESRIRFSLVVASDHGTAALQTLLDDPSVELRCLHEPTSSEEATEKSRPSANAEDAPTPSRPPANAEEAPDVAGASAEGARSEPQASEVHQDDSAPARPGYASTPASGAGSSGGARSEPQASEVQELESLKSISETVRVDIRKLDELMNLVGELVIQRGAIAAIAERMRSDPASARLGRELDKVHKTLERKLQDLQAGVLEVRMVPLRQVFEKLSRVVRRLGRDSGKDVRLEIRGGETELDKLIVEELADPLMHVVRNAFDHAIEPSAERVAAGKPPEGTIRLQALQRGNHVVVQITDDGRGIDADAVLARAIERRLVDPAQPLGRQDVLDLVFLPGLSTRAQVTETSGRGVGMDVVRESVTSLGGLVSIESDPGRGTTIAFTMPITLAIIQALVVGVGEQRFAIPLTSVLETLLVEAHEIQRSESQEFLSLRGEPLALRRLQREFDLPEPAPDARQAVVVVGIGDSRAGLLVDFLDGQQDAVIKPIQGPVPSVRGIAGATELGDRGTVLVLDVAALVEDAGRRREAA
ncbi:MAG: chemotaxis protein CheA [Myxococcota bacterium]|nr:chemotaxis protein CheA [Myxococcota bacterium]